MSTKLSATGTNYTWEATYEDPGGGKMRLKDSNSPGVPLIMRDPQAGLHVTIEEDSVLQLRVDCGDPYRGVPQIFITDDEGRAVEYHDPAEELYLVSKGVFSLEFVGSRQEKPGDVTYIVHVTVSPAEQ